MNIYTRLVSGYWLHLTCLQVLQIGLDVASAMAHLHPHYVHRDLKPQNVLLDRYNGVRRLPVDNIIALPFIVNYLCHALTHTDGMDTLTLTLNPYKTHEGQGL